MVTNLPLSNRSIIPYRAKPIEVNNEDDILHLSAPELPTFGNMLKPSESERLIQFLTVPYIRIPLVLDFFANGNPERLSALKCKSLQLILDAALFEPGSWRPADFTHYVTEIPIVDEAKLEALLSTPMGSMFNEIAKSPDVLTKCVIKILERSLEMDVGKYNASTVSGPMILYAVRLAVRVEGYLKLALRYCKPGQSRPRGLESLDYIKIETAMKKIRNILEKEAFRTLEYWIDPSRVKDVNIRCLVHAHLLYLFKNYTFEDLDYRAISVLLSSQVYLAINHRFSNNAYDDLQDSSDPSQPPPSIQIAQSEIFDIIQSHRFNILKYMREHPDEADEAMEAVVRLATGTGPRTIDKELAALRRRHWQSISHSTCYGRFVPDTEDENLRDGSYRNPKPGQTYEEWMLYVTTKAVGTEVNVQLSEFTLQNHKMMLLDEKILKSPDFAPTYELEMKDATDIACAEVMHTTKRYWWRLVGRRYDVQSWAPDDRNYYELKGAINPKFTRKFPNKLRGTEKWIADILNDKIPLLLPGVNLFMLPDNLSDAPYVQLSGWIENPRAAGTINTHTVKEVIVWQNPPVISIYNVKEHGRRHFRTLEYTSNMSVCSHEVSGEPYPDRVAGMLALSAGIPMTTAATAASLIISRSLNSKIGNQVYIPDRFLAGILPTALIEKYHYWQSDDDNIIGYEINSPTELEDSPSISAKASTRIKITLIKSKETDKTGFCNSEANALIQRIPLLNSDHETEEVDTNQNIVTLFNILSAPKSSFLKRLGMLLSRLDNLSHVLVWSYSRVISVDDACSIDLIELPRANLSFKARKVETIGGKVEYRLYSNDHDGLYICTSTEARDIAESLLGSIAHFIVLQNEDNDLFVLIPGCALPRRLHNDGSHLSVQIILDRRNQEWIDNIGEVRCYLYPIHNSRSFLITPSLASSMYLMVLYFITGSYREVFKMVESCVSEELSAEEVSFDFNFFLSILRVLFAQSLTHIYFSFSGTNIQSVGIFGK